MLTILKNHAGIPTLPNLYLRIEPGFDVTRRARGVEALLHLAAQRHAIDDWRADAQGLLGGSQPAVGAAAVILAGAALARPLAQVFMATPLHTQATLTSVRLPAEGLLRLEAAEARALAEDFAALPPADRSPAPTLIAIGATLLFGFDTALEVDSVDPSGLLGFDLREFRPRGAGAAQLAALGSEVEMWLFGHAVNRDRLRRGALPITALWPWGGAAVTTGLARMPFALQGEDTILSDWARRAPPAAGADTLIVARPERGRSGIDDWLSPHLPALRAGLARGEGAIHLSHGRRRYSMRRMPRRWFAPRGRPWWEFFDESD